jgi:hypothetical protein
MMVFEPWTTSDTTSSTPLTMASDISGIDLAIVSTIVAWGIYHAMVPKVPNNPTAADVEP